MTEIATQPTVGVNVALKIDDKMKVCFGRLNVKGLGEWVIPESYSVERHTDLPQREPFPTFHVDNSLTWSMKPKSLLELAQELNIRIDSYEISFGKKYSLCKRAKAFDLKQEFYPVVVQGSGRQNDGPCGMICPGESAGSWKLILLPYNFQELIPLLKTAVEEIKVSSSHSWVPPWRNRFANYVTSIPSYYQPALSNILKKLNLFVLASQPLEYKPRSVKQIVKYQENASVDISALEVIASLRLPISTGFNIATISDLSCQQLTTWEIFQNVLDCSASSLFGLWERHRRALFGGGGSQTLIGFSERASSQSGSVLCSEGVGILPYWEHACGVNLISRCSMREMSNYSEVLARREVLRSTDHDCDDSPKERIKRY